MEVKGDEGMFTFSSSQDSITVSQAGRYIVYLQIGSQVGVQVIMGIYTIVYGDMRAQLVKHLLMRYLKVLDLVPGWNDNPNFTVQ
jgi:hypothetical protein